MSLTNRPPAAGEASAAHRATLMPMLRTAKRVKRSLPPVRPSLAFQASLENELLGVARRLAMSRGNVPRTVVRDVQPAGVRTGRAAAILVGLAAVSVLVALVLLMGRADQKRRPG
jgi:hypothetical protein